jgi:hypothetical protein
MTSDPAGMCLLPPLAPTVVAVLRPLAVVRRARAQRSASAPRALAAPVVRPEAVSSSPRGEGREAA